MTETAPMDEDASPAEETFTSHVRRVKLKSEEHDALALLLDEALTAIKRQREERGWDEDWDRWEDSYFGITADRPAGRANVHVPLSQEIVDTAWAVIDKGIFSVQPWMQIQPREAMDVDVAKRKEQHLDYALNVEMKARERLDTLTWEMLVLNTGVAYLPWLREMDRIRDEETYDGQRLEDMERFDQRYPNADEDFPEITKKLRAGKKITLNVEYNEALHDAPDVQHIPLRKWIVRDTAQPHQLHRERFVGHAFDLRWADVKEQISQGYYDDVTAQLQTTVDAEGLRTTRLDAEDQPYTLVTGIVRWKRPGQTRERRFLVDFHQQSRTIARILYYPYWHNRVNYIPFYLQRSRRYIYGVSLLQKIESSQDEVNATHNVTLDAVSFGSLPMFKARKTAIHDFNPMRDGMFPGKTFFLDNPQDVEQFQVQVSSALAVLAGLEQSATRHAELSSGATQNLSGLESSADPQAPGNKTAILVQQSLIRVGKYLATYGASLSELAYQAEQLYYQFSPKGRIFRAMGEKGVPAFPTISRQELRLRADYYPHGSTAALNPDQEKRDTIEALGLLLKNPDIMQAPLKRWAAFETALDVMGSGWEKKKHLLLPSSEEMKILRQQEEMRIQQLKQQTEQGIAENPALTPSNGNGAPASLSPGMQALLSGGGRQPMANSQPGGLNAGRPTSTL